MKNLLLIALVTISVLPAHADSSGFPDKGSKADWLKANGFYAEGNNLSQKKKFAEAIAKYDEAIKIYPDDFHYHFNLGLALKHAGRMKDAANELQQATTLNASDWKSWKALGNCYYTLNQCAEARSAFEKCLEAHPPQKEVTELHKAIAACRRN